MQRTPTSTSRVLVSALLPVMTACALAVGGCQSGSPFAGASGVEVTFISAAQTWDLNKDNVVTCDEWKQYLATSFGEVDANKDGNLSKEEFARLAKQDKLFEEANYEFFGGKADGKLSLAEMQNRPNPAFKRLDKDGDCRLVSTEMVRQHQVEKAKDPDWQSRQDALRK